MRIFILLLVACGLARADTASLPERYVAWKYAAEVQVRNTGPRERLREVIDVGLRLPASRAGNLKGDARVVLKRGYDELVREVPFQIYDIATSGGYTTCRVAFCADLPANSSQRFAVFYDNPAARAPVFEPMVRLVRSAGSLAVRTPFYAAEFDEETGQCVGLKSLVAPGGTLYAEPADHRGGSPWPLPSVSVPALETEENRPEALRLAKASGDGEEILEGPVFAAVRGRRHFLGKAGEAPAALDFAYVFYAEAPHFVVGTAVSFLRDTNVYSLETNALGADQALLTHYLFRPVTPTFPLTEIEEVGSVMVDTATRKGYPDGDLLAGMLPADLAWNAVSDIDSGLTATGFNLLRKDSAPNRHAANYRASTRARLREGWVEWSNAPVYVTARERLSDAILVSQGTVFRSAQAVALSNFKDGDWRAKTDDYGRRLNTPMEINIYPRGTGVADDEKALPHYGVRVDAYLRGIR